jgi:hypothetical protein
LLAAVEMSLLEGDAHMAWMKNLSGIKKATDELAAATDIGSARAAFDPLSVE